MNELTAAVGKYNFNDEAKEEINGNTFTFKKSFPIQDYRSELAEIGKEDTGNSWYVRLDDEGRVVIY